MDKEELVKEIREVLNNFIEEISKVNMAILIKDVNADTYTFLLSAKYFDSLNEYEAIKIVAEYFYKKLRKEAFSIISRINIVTTLDKNLDCIYNGMKVTQSILYAKNCKIFNVVIPDVIFLESNRDI